MGKKIKESIKYILRSYLVIKKYVDEVNSLYNKTPQDLLKWKEARFHFLLNRAYNYSEFYHSLYDDAGIDIHSIKSLDDIVKLPVITKDGKRIFI